MRIIVTGSSGFVGRWLVRAAAERASEVVADRSKTGERLDVTDRDATMNLIIASQPDAVVHLAAVASNAEARRDPDHAMHVAVDGTAAVIDGLAALADKRTLAQPPPIALIVSSGEVYGAPAPGDLPLRETSPVRPGTPYAQAKVAQEVEAARGPDAGLRVVIARPFNHTGPGQTASYAIPAFATRILEARATGKRTISVGDLDIRRDIGDVRDVVQAYLGLLDAFSANEEPGMTIVNIATGRSVPLREIVERLAAIVGVEVEPVVDPDLLRPGEPRDIVGDASVLRTMTGWQPGIRLEQTLADIVAESSTTRPGTGVRTLSIP